MARRTEIVNYLIHQLKGISDDPVTNRANGVAQVTSSAVSGVTVDFGGRFYSEAPSVTFESPGKTTANVIPTVANGNVSFSVDVGGGSYTENPDITLEITRDNVGFTTEHAKFGSRSWEVNTEANLPVTFPRQERAGVIGFWLWPSSEISDPIEFMRIGGDQFRDLRLRVFEFADDLLFGYIQGDGYTNANPRALTPNDWNFVQVRFGAASGNTIDLTTVIGGTGSGQSGQGGVFMTDNNVQILTASANGLIYIDDLTWADRQFAIFPDPSSANAYGGDSIVYFDFETPPTFNTTVTTNGAISSNTVVAVSNLDTDYTISAATVTSVEAPANDLDPAEGFASLNAGGVVGSVTITDGSSYSFVPNVTFGDSQIQFNSEDIQVDRRYRYLDDINDFPTVTLGGTPVEDYELLGNGQQLKTLRQSIRGYVYADQDDSLRESENLARDVEAVVSRFAEDASNLSVYRSEVTSIGTDEGLMAPYGVSEIEVRILYDDN
jgi:hypothetical protein